MTLGQQQQETSTHAFSESSVLQLANLLNMNTWFGTKLAEGTPRKTYQFFVQELGMNKQRQISKDLQSH